MAKLKSVQTEEKPSESPKCGIVMPIATGSGYSSAHWIDVYEIIKEALSSTNFETRLVSQDEVIGLIHERIVTNLYQDEIVIVDVSSKNPNVMFELGLRLAFDKPTIIIKDDKTDFSFDSGVIEHLSYPSSLHYHDIEKFKKELLKRILATTKKKSEDPDYSPFLKSFTRTIIPKKIETESLSESAFIIKELEAIKEKLSRIDYKSKSNIIKSHWTNYIPNSNEYRNETDEYKRLVFKLFDDITSGDSQSNNLEIIETASEILKELGFKTNQFDLAQLFSAWKLRYYNDKGLNKVEN